MKKTPLTFAVEVYNTLWGAHFMQASRSYVPKWMTCLTFYVNASQITVKKTQRDLTIEIRWVDSRSKEPSRYANVWLEKYWKYGVEGMLKSTIQRAAKLYKDSPQVPFR